MNKRRSIGVPDLGLNDMKNFVIPLIPQNEQHRIVSKIEELFTKLDAGIDALKKTKIQLKNYRQSILKYTFEGKLTKRWRAVHEKEIESASTLLEKIKEVRRRRTRDQYNEPNSGDRQNFLHLPEGWVWTSVDQITEKMQYGSSEKAIDDANGIPVLRMGNIQDGKINFKGLKSYPITWHQVIEFLLEDGDVLFNRTNSAELVGKSAVYEKHYPQAVFASYLIRVRTNKDVYNPKLLSLFINSYYGRQYIRSVVSQQVGQANVNGTKLAAMPIPLLPIQEQNEIIGEIERRFSIIENNQQVVNQSLQQTKTLKQSILEMTFAGKLILQDPSDEPASILLERVREDKANKVIVRKMNKRIKNKLETKQMRLV